MKIPLVDLKAQYLSIKNEIDNAIQNVIDSSSFIRGDFVKTFEDEFSKAYGVKHTISCGNGTDALYIILKSLGIGVNDEVITVANSWFSTSETIGQTGAKPIFIDIHPDYYTIDVSKIEEKINKNTKAIIPVHLFGQPAEMEKIIELCNKYKLALIEDCAQAHFAEWKGKKVGTFGIAGSFSFFPGKNLGAYGDAGAIITNDDKFAEDTRKFANHGSLIKHQHEIEGINSRMDGMQAAILSVKLKYITEWTIARQKIAQKYNELFENNENVIFPKIHPNVSHVFHLYVIRHKRRNELLNQLKQKGVFAEIHYPNPLPFLKAYSHLGYKPTDFPISYKYKDEIISLPIYPEITNEQINYIVDIIKKF